MTTRYATNKEITDWNSHIAANPDGGNILQGKEFVEQKALAGWKPRYVFVNTRAVGVVEKSIPSLGKLWYCPKGPSVTSVDDLSDIVSQLKAFAKKEGVFSIKIEPELPAGTHTDGIQLLKTRPIQYNYSTVLIDLSPSLDDIMTVLPQKGRHAIKRAKRDGVTVKRVQATKENNRKMYGLFKATAQAGNFAIRPEEYYQKFYTRYSESGNGQLFFAYFEGSIVAGAFALRMGKKSMYKDGASIRNRTAYGASHLLQWHVIQWAKQNGSVEHDLAGIPPVSQLEDTNHPMHGLVRFKTSFNKTVTEYIGAYDIPVHPRKAKLWHAYVEKVVRRAYFKIHKQSYY